MGFEEFVDKQNELAKAQKECNKKLIIDTFRENVNTLYADIVSWLKPYVQSNKMRVDRKSILLREEKLGEYEIDAQVIRIGQNEVSLIPYGTRLIGTNARVDIKTYGIPYAYMVRAGKNISSTSQMISVTVAGETKPKQDPGPEEWKIVRVRERKKLITLTQKEFEQILMEAIDNG